MATISEVLKTKTDDEEEPKKKSREDWRKAKELEEARKVSFIYTKFECLIIICKILGRNSSSGS